MFKLCIQDWTSPIQCDQNDEALIVLDCNDAVTEKVREQKSHTKLRQIYKEISKIISDFVNLKLKAKDIVKLCPDIW